MNNKPGY